MGIPSSKGREVGGPLSKLGNTESNKVKLGRLRPLSLSGEL